VIWLLCHSANGIVAFECIVWVEHKKKL
jgi:hypothetical protein